MAAACAPPESLPAKAVPCAHGANMPTATQRGKNKRAASAARTRPPHSKTNAKRPTFHPSKGSRFLIVYFFLFLRASIAARPAAHRAVLNDAIISSDNRADSLSCSAVAIRKGLSPAVPISPIFACSSSDNSACFGSPAVNACALFCAEVAFRSIIGLYNAQKTQ